MGSTAYYAWDVMGNLTAVTDYLGRGSTYTYDLEGNLTSVTDAAGRKESMSYDAASRMTSYTSNGGDTIRYDYNKLNALVEKSYTDAAGKESADPADYAYDALGERTSMEDSTGDTVYTYDTLGRITSVTTCRTVHKDGSTDLDNSDTIGYTYDGADNLSAITYPDGISTYKAYNARNQMTELTNRCDDCGWVLGYYTYTYDDRGYIAAEHTEEARERPPAPHPL